MRPYSQCFSGSKAGILTGVWQSIGKIRATGRASTVEKVSGSKIRLAG